MTFEVDFIEVILDNLLNGSASPLNVFPVLGVTIISESNSDYKFSIIFSIPLNAAINIIKAAVTTAIPIMEIRVIK